MGKKTFLDKNEEIAEKVTEGFTKMSDGVVGGYKKIEDTVVGGYKKVEDAFVARFLTHEGETVEQAKERLRREEEARRAAKPEQREESEP